MKKLLILFACLPLLGACTQTEPVSGNRAAAIVAEIHNPRSKNVVVASHRGDWRNYPENSIAAIESVIGMGVDIMELDLKLTKDSVLVLCHDRTIDRTTSGKGRVCDITYDSIRRCVLKTGHGVKTTHRMPTLREALEVCKDRIVVNVDQGYEYYDLVLAVTEELGVTVGIEPVTLHSMNSPAATRHILDTMRSPNLKVIFDMSNLVDAGNVGAQDRIWNDVGELLGDQIVAVHFKGQAFAPDGGLLHTSLEDSLTDYAGAFAILRQLPQDALPVLREEAVPARAASDIAFMRGFFS